MTPALTSRPGHLMAAEIREQPAIWRSPEATEPSATTVVMPTAIPTTVRIVRTR